MDSEQINSILFFIVLIMLSAFFSSSETAYTSVNRIRLKNEADNGDRRAQSAFHLQSKFDSLLSTVLIGNNLVNIASSAIATVFFINLFPTYGATIATFITTITLLIFGEVTPKLLAKISPEAIAKRFAPILSLLMTLFKPIVWLFDLWQQFVKRIVPVSDSLAISEEELLSIVDEAQIDGSIEEEEHRLVRAAIEFDDKEVYSIVTPRVDVIGFDINDTDEEIADLFSVTPYSRLIVYEDDVDNVIGTLHVKDFYRYLHAKEKNQITLHTLNNLIIKPLFVPPSMLLSDLLTALKEAHTHIGIVIDEYGGMIGIATMEDALEELVGEIWDESDIIRTEIMPLDETDKYLVQGTYSIDKLFEIFGVKSDEEWHSNSVSGFVYEQFDRIPMNNDTFEYQGIQFTVANAYKRRINEVIVERIDPSEKLLIEQPIEGL